MLGGRTSEQWIAQYASSHTHPVNRLRAGGGGNFLPSALDARRWTLHLRLDIAVHRPRFRAQRAGILSRLALPPGWRALVVGQDARQSLAILVCTAPDCWPFA